MLFYLAKMYSKVDLKGVGNTYVYICTYLSTH